MNKTNMKDNHSLTIPVLSSPIDAVTKKTGVSVFTDQIFSMDDYNGLFITPRIGALNFRHRYSEANYSSDWHMAGDATLLIIRSGTLRIGLRNGDYKDFSAGDMFIAKDRLQKEEVFNSDLHGHTAAVIGEHNLTAVHIKLSED